MANPILSRPDAFTRRQPVAGPGVGMSPGHVPAGLAPQGAVEPTMSIDGVINKTGATMLVLMAVAIVTYLGLDRVDYPRQAAASGGALVLSGIVGFVTVLLVSLRKRISPALVLFYAAVEGVFIGAFSFWFNGVYPGIVQQAVLGTFATALCTLGAYRFFGIRVSNRMRRMVFIGTAAFAGVMLVNFLLALAGIDMGVRSGALGLLAALVGVGLAVFNLVVDFDDIERAIAQGAPAGESWRAAFGLTVTMVWLYTEILRLLGYFRR